MAKRNPTPEFYGYWISPAGELIPVDDHFEEVRLSPRKFGWTLADTVGWTQQDREPVLYRTIERGWTRIRQHRRFTTFETWSLTDKLLQRIQDYADRFNLWDDDRIEIHVLSDGTAIRETVGWLREAVRGTVKQNPRVRLRLHPSVKAYLARARS